MHAEAAQLDDIYNSARVYKVQRYHIWRAISVSYKANKCFQPRLNDWKQ